MSSGPGCVCRGRRCHAQPGNESVRYNNDEHSSTLQATLTTPLFYRYTTHHAALCASCNIYCLGELLERARTHVTFSGRFITGSSRGNILRAGHHRVISRTQSPGGSSPGQLRVRHLEDTSRCARNPVHLECRRMQLMHTRTRNPV